AFNIFVKDTLSAKLDWNSLEMVSASHDYKLTINNGICTWHFDNIHLVDSNHNEPLSHGYLAFKIAARSSVVAGDVIQNRASIYFDYNLPVVTNTETTAIITQVFPVKLVSFTATKRSSDNLLQWLVEKQTNFSHYNVERSGNGRDFTRIATIPGGPNEFSFADDKFAPALNYYRLKMVDVDGKTEYSPVQRVNNAGSMDVTLYPNPAKDILQLRIESITPRSIELEVISPDGRVIIRKVISLPGGISVTPVRIDPLSKGSYVLKINHGDEAPVVLRFQKQ
ncbi:MAG: type sorting protein, partial [Chitinophagaceae bacterium]|nr:type sorting protein [Chitinophagaceae bacterium]